MLVELIFWPISSSLDIGKMLLASITVEGGESCSSIYGRLSLDFVPWHHCLYIWAYYYYFNHPLLDIIVVFVHII